MRPGRRWNRLKGRGASKEKWTIVSYNILSPSLCSAHAELYRQNKFTGWKERKKRLMRELESYDAAIYALQECNAEIVEKLQKYKGVVWAPREDDRGDGCAIAYDRNRFRLEQFEAVRLDASASRYESCAIAVLDENMGNLTIIVASVHLIYNPKRGDLRLRQIEAVSRRTSELTRMHAKRQRDVAHIVCGDFNSTPSSGVYAYMAKGSVDAEHLDRRTKKTGEGEERRCFDRGHAGSGTSILTLLQEEESSHDRLINPLKSLKSAYAERHADLPDHCPGEPCFTTYLEFGTKACVDYIFYDSDKLNVHGRYEMLPLHMIERTSGLPSPEAPSDHMALVVQMSANFKVLTCGQVNGRGALRRGRNCREELVETSEKNEASLVR